MNLDPETKYAIADRITIEGRSKADVVQDVWDELSGLFIGLSEAVERNKLSGDKRTIMKAVMKACGSPYTDPEECPQTVQRFLSDVVDAVMEVLK